MSTVIDNIEISAKIEGMSNVSFDESSNDSSNDTLLNKYAGNDITIDLSIKTSLFALIFRIQIISGSRLEACFCKCDCLCYCSAFSEVVKTLAQSSDDDLSDLFNNKTTLRNCDECYDNGSGPLKCDKPLHQCDKLVHYGSSVNKNAGHIMRAFNPFDTSLYVFCEHFRACNTRYGYYHHRGCTDPMSYLVIKTETVRQCFIWAASAVSDGFRKK